jgi:protocatechuate 3,4-dioxygenase beta subunit
MLLALFIVLAGVPVSGRVVDAESRNPIAGAHVELIPERNITVVSPSSLQAITDQNGRFVLEGVAPGHYLVNATKAGFAPIVDPAEMPAVDIIEGRAFTGVEVSLMKGGAMTGRVVDARGEPVAGIMVSALRQSVDQRTGGIGAFTAQMTQTNDLGEFRLAGLQAGRYAVVAAPGPPAAPFGQPTAAKSGEALVPTFYPGTTDKDAAEILTVAAAQTVTGVQFSMIAIRAYQVSGVVVDDAGAPLSGAMVMLLLESRDGGVAPLMGRSDETGTFRIGGVVPGPYRIIASTPTMWPTPDGSAVVGAGGGGAGGGGMVVTGGVLIGGSGRGGPGVPPPWATTMPSPSPVATAMPAPIKVTVDNADVTGLKIVVTRR